MTQGESRAKSFFLSASVPNRRGWTENGDRDAAMRIRAAVIAITRRVLHDGDNIVFGGHPSISPFVLSVAEGYLGAGSSATESPSQARITVYQSEAYPPAVRPEATIRLGEAGARIVNTPAEDGERFDPNAVGKEQCKKSLAAMRERMLTEYPLSAMILIGGMEGTLRECRLFRDHCPERKIFVLRTTGGLAREVLAPELSAVQAAFQEEGLSGPEDLPLTVAENLVGVGFDPAYPPFVLVASRISGGH